MNRPKVVIIGGGFGGLNAAKSLKKADVDLLLIDKTNHHLFQPLLYEVATAALSPGEIATPIREILRGQDNATVLMGDVITIDKTQKKVTLDNGDRIDFDILIVATGARHSYFGNDKWEQFAPGLKTINDAINLRQHILISFEKAERLAETSGDISKYLNFVIIGGGPTGVEMSGAIAEIAYKTMFKNFRKIKPENSKIFLIEATPFILPVYSQKLSLRAKKDLEELGVNVIVGKKVTNVTEEGVQVEDSFIPSVNVIWAAGNQGSAILKTLEVPMDRQGRVIVEKDLTIPGHPNIFVIGDAAHAAGPDGKPLPGIAPTAIQQAKYVAKLIKTNKPPQERLPFKYFDKGSMATIGKSRAIVSVGKIQFAGFFAWLTWCFIHIVYLIGFRNRFSVMAGWMYTFFTGSRGVRLIYRPIDEELPKV
jgi:NADH dehydrogenase